MTIHVPEGTFRLSTASAGDTEARFGELIALDTDVPHTGHATGYCVLLLTGRDARADVPRLQAAALPAAAARLLDAAQRRCLSAGVH